MSTLHKDHRDVLIAPVVSEKSYGLLDANKYTFLVRPAPTRPRSRSRSRRCSTSRSPASTRSTARARPAAPGIGTGKRKDTKRAIVSLAEGQRIDIFGGPVS